VGLFALKVLISGVAVWLNTIWSPGRRLGQVTDEFVFDKELAQAWKSDFEADVFFEREHGRRVEVSERWANFCELARGAERILKLNPEHALALL
jgi:hypothetical protein